MHFKSSHSMSVWANWHLISLSFLSRKVRVMVWVVTNDGAFSTESVNIEICPDPDSNNWCQRSASRHHCAWQESCHTDSTMWMERWNSDCTTHMHRHMNRTSFARCKHTQKLLTQASELLTWPPLARFSRRIQVAFISHTGHSMSWTTAPSSPAVTTLNCTAVLSFTSAVQRQLRLQVHSTLWPRGRLAPVTPGL